MAWRESFVTTYLERDSPQLGPRIPVETLRRFWTWSTREKTGTRSGVESRSWVFESWHPWADEAALSFAPLAAFLHAFTAVSMSCPCSSGR